MEEQGLWLESSIVHLIVQHGGDSEGPKDETIGGSSSSLACVNLHIARLEELWILSPDRDDPLAHPPSGSEAQTHRSVAPEPRQSRGENPATTIFSPVM